METNMNEFILATYVLALISLVCSIWAIVEVREMRKSAQRRQIEKRLQQVVESTKTKPKKGLWD